jgi:hypothetical protein
MALRAVGQASYRFIRPEEPFCRSAWLRQVRFEVPSWLFEKNWKVVYGTTSPSLQHEQNVDYRVLTASARETSVKDRQIRGSLENCCARAYQEKLRKLAFGYLYRRKHRWLRNISGLSGEVL